MAVTAGAGDTQWGEADRTALVLARRQHAHTQAQAAQRISELAMVEVRQFQVSKWERGLTKQPDASVVAAIRAYGDEAHTAPTDGPKPRPSLAAEQEGEGDEADTLQRLFAASGAEPILGPRQADLIDGVIARIASGPPLSEADLVILRAVGRALGLTL